MTPKQVLDMAKENGAKLVDLRFMDFPGLWQHFSVPIGELEEASFEDGFGFDGSSIRGWQPIQRHAGHPGCGNGQNGSLFRRPDPDPDLQHR